MPLALPAPAVEVFDDVVIVSVVVQDVVELAGAEEELGGADGVVVVVPATVLFVVDAEPG